MDLTSIIQKRTTAAPPRIVLHGIHGIGKTTFGAKAPAPIFLITEDGLTNVQVDHFPLVKDVGTAFQYMSALIEQDHEYKTFVVDTADWLEKLIWKQVCQDHQVESIENIGYGKGYVFAMNYWDRFINGLETLRDKGMAILILAHNEIKTYNPPDGEAYDRYQIKLHRQAAAKLEEWADLVLFATFNVIVNKDGKAVNVADRVIHTANRPAWRAKSRYDLPDTIPMDFGKLLEYISGKNGQKAGGK